MLKYSRFVCLNFEVQIIFLMIESLYKLKYINMVQIFFNCSRTFALIEINFVNPANSFKIVLNLFKIYLILYISTVFTHVLIKTAKF